jgi:hypothetical protein
VVLDGLELADGPAELPPARARFANVMVFLASDYSSYLTGEILSVSSQHP